MVKVDEGTKEAFRDILDYPDLCECIENEDWHHLFQWGDEGYIDNEQLGLFGKWLNDLTKGQFMVDCEEVPTACFSSTNITSINIPEGVKRIMDYAFEYTDIQTVVIPDGVGEIGWDAFYACEKLRDIYIPDSIIYIWGDVFDCCPNILVHTNNPYVIEYCDIRDIPHTPIISQS